MDTTEPVSIGSLLREILPRVVPVLVVYYGARLCGLTDYVSVILAALVAIPQSLYAVVRKRTVDVMTIVMLVFLGLSLIATIVTYDARTMLLMNCASGLSLDIVIFFSGLVGKPATLFISEKLFPESKKPALVQQGWIEEDFTAYRAFHVRISLFLGFCGVLNGLLCLAIVLTTSVDVAQITTSAISVVYALSIPLYTLRRVRVFIRNRNVQFVAARTAESDAVGQG